jgi:hypothetical protein
MTTKQELAVLRELVRVYQDCPTRVSAYVRLRWIFTGIAWVLCFMAFLLISFEDVSPRLCLLIALVAGFAVGCSLMYAASAKQMPLLVRFTTIHDADMQRRIEELSASSTR